MTNLVERLARSYLYVPADAGERLSRASSRGADAVIADLEDAVAANRKDVALRGALAWLATPLVGVERWVRVNAGERGLDELVRILPGAPTGICLPKVGGPQLLREAAVLLDGLEAELPPDQRGTQLMPVIESAEGLLSAPAIAAASRVRRLQLGEIDLLADLGMQADDAEATVLPLRTAVVLASAAAAIAPPIGPVSAQFRDPAPFEESTRRLLLLGFVGRAVIHPSQIPVVHKVFTPSLDEIHRARALVARYDEANTAGAGVLLDDDGRMVDEAVVRWSRRTVALARMSVTEEDT